MPSYHPEWIAHLAQDLLDTAIHAYDASDAPPLPAHQAVLFGHQPALDCELLAVCATHVEARPPPMQRCTVVARVRMSVWIARCYPVMQDDGTPPTRAAEMEASMLLATDLGTIWNHLVGTWADGRIFQRFEGINCEAVTWGLTSAVGPSGGLAAYQIPLIVDYMGGFGAESY
jgi:hypothetical protein